MKNIIDIAAKLIIGWLPGGTATKLAGLSAIIWGAYLLSTGDQTGTQIIIMGLGLLGIKRALESAK